MNVSDSRILLIIGTNAATVAFSNSFLEHHKIIGLIQQSGGPESDNYVEICPVQEKPEFNPLGNSEESVLGYVYDNLYVSDLENLSNLRVKKGELNNEEIIKWIDALKPDIIISHGPERISQKIIDITTFGGINVHWGLSPIYRGTHTIRWPLLHSKAEWVGVTIHLLDKGLDTGPILYQAKPELVPGYSYRQIEYSLTKLACEIVPHALVNILSGNINPAQQDKSIGKNYLSKEWTKECEEKLSIPFIKKQIENYHNNKEELDKSVSLINEWKNEK